MNSSIPKTKCVGLIMSIMVASGSANAATILSTDFTDRTVSGTTAGNITWTANGVSDPGDLTASANLFVGGDTAGHFAVNSNVGNGNPWTTTINFSVIGSPISLNSVDLASTHFNGSAGFQTAIRSTDFKIDVIGSTSMAMGSLTGTNTSVIADPSDSFSESFSSPIILTNAETYQFVITASMTPGSAAGNNAGIDSIAFNGTVVPEPSSSLLLGLGSAVFILRRRR